MTINEIKQHITDLMTEGTVPTQDALIALEYLNAHNVNQAIATIIKYI
jgi:hypothetical protein